AFDLHRHYYNYYGERVGGFGPAWILLLAPAVVASIWLAARWRRLSYLSLVALPIVTLCVATGGLWHARLTLALPGLGAAGFAAALEALRRQRSLAPRILGSCLAPALVALAFLGAWWATNPTDFEVVGPKGLVPLTVSQVTRMMSSSDDAYDTLWPWLYYQDVRSLPKNSTVLLDETNDPFFFPYTGSDIQYRVVVDDKATTAASVAAAMRADEAEWVVVPAIGSHTLADELESDSGTFEYRGLVGADELFLKGSFRDCGSPSFSLVSNHLTGSLARTVTFKLASSSCGPIPQATVTVSSGTDAPGTLTSRTATVRTDAAGVGTVVLTGVSASRPFFFRFAGLTGTSNYAPAASAVYGLPGRRPAHGKHGRAKPG
ncbi:MAG TPA: hypothetical protein VGP46_01175, partial [Acidimicrobiales bacterium]|nr:hypothetical protein [Acidimicrobiales bacterium]